MSKGELVVGKVSGKEWEEGGRKHAEVEVWSAAQVNPPVRTRWAAPFWLGIAVGTVACAVGEMVARVFSS
jgi:hypothetical protein